MPTVEEGGEKGRGEEREGRRVLREACLEGVMGVYYLHPNTSFYFIYLFLYLFLDYLFEVPN